jgi:polar amino acid transport system substrate-binding protein
VVIEVRDEGVGIPAEHLRHLLDPFFTTKRETGGTGLGLTISDGIVREHGGKLVFISEPGKGTTVSVQLPAVEEGI